MAATRSSSPGLDRALSPSIVKAARVCQEKGLTKYRWSCKSFPELHPRFDGHLLAQTSRPGRERWLQPEENVGSKAWFNKTGKHHQGRKWLSQYQEFTGHLSDSWNLHPTLPVRDAWIQGSPLGCIHGNPTQLDPPLLGHQPKGYARWVAVGERWTPNKHNVPRVVSAKEFNKTSQAGLLAFSQGKDAKAARKSAKEKHDATLLPKRGGSPKGLGSTLNSTGAASATSGTGLSGSQSLPTLARGPFPPSPAYVRSFMRQIDLEQPDVIKEKRISVQSSASNN